jgi:hypothetical protein
VTSSAEANQLIESATKGLPALQIEFRDLLIPVDDDVIVPHELTRLFTDGGGAVALFVGAGASMAMRIPDWNGLARKALEHLHTHCGFSYAQCEYLKSQFTDPKQLLSVFHSYVKLDSPAASKFYAEALVANGTSRIYQLLGRFECIKVTTNLEDQFGIGVDSHRRQQYAHSFRKESEPPPPKVSRICVPSGEVLSLDSLSVDAVYHAHGTLRSLKHAVMTTEKYISAYYGALLPDGSNSPVFKFLNNLFQNYSVIFVGTSLGELSILERLLSARQSHSHRRHFAVFPVLTSQVSDFSAYGRYLDVFGIEPVPYYLDAFGHPRLEQVLEKWVEHIDSLRKPNYFDINRRIRSVLSK